MTNFENNGPAWIGGKTSSLLMMIAFIEEYVRVKLVANKDMCLTRYVLMFLLGNTKTYVYFLLLLTGEMAQEAGIVVEGHSPITLHTINIIDDVLTWGLIY